MQDGVAIYLWRLIENPPLLPPPIAVQAMHLLTDFVAHPGSTACLDLYDEHAVPRLVNMLTQPTSGLTRTEAGRTYQNAVEAGQPPPALTAADVEAQRAIAPLLAALVRVSSLCCQQVWPRQLNRGVQAFTKPTCMTRTATAVPT